MSRDSLFGDEVVWSGRPKLVTVPPILRWASIVSGVVALTTTLSAVAVATVLNVAVGSMLLFAAWMASLSLAFWRFPLWWRSELEFAITDENIIIRRGRYRRFIDRRSISFARIHWHHSHSDVGDLELVRAVPTGALRRRLTIVLTGISAPDRVWAFVRGITPATPAGDGHRLLAQRLDEGERVLWSANPASNWTRWVPTNARGVLSLLLGLSLVVSAFLIASDAIRGMRHVLSAGVHPASISFIALVASLTLSVALVGAAAVGVVYASVVKPARLERLTRYLITDRRVLIQRGTEELHLDRERIVDVIDAPCHGGKTDLFLVLDGPKARAFAPSGAFGEQQGSGLQPVLKLVDDAESVQRILKTRPSIELAA
ncbi:MAG: hypothetical protein HOW73_17705 [Polyangiaceae bacterium]|nr:hypothetical protein [Polyangiaceae bacterium]